MFGKLAKSCQSGGCAGVN